MNNKILIVDDTVTMRLTQKIMLENENFAIDMAQDGIEALESINKNMPDLLLLDIMMPNMDGIECCKKIKSNTDLKDIKIIMVTTKNEYVKVKEAFAAGCNDYISKPIDKTELIKKVKDLLQF